MHWGEMARQGGVPPETPRRSADVTATTRLSLNKRHAAHACPRQCYSGLNPLAPSSKSTRIFVGVAAARAARRLR